MLFRSLIDAIYLDKEGVEQTRKSITFNPFLKTKLYVLASCFIKLRESPYRKIYDDYKHRIANHPDHVEKSLGHRHNMAQRYMLKRFLADLYVAWRILEGLPISVEYYEGKLGGSHRKAA